MIVDVLVLENLEFNFGCFGCVVQCVDGFIIVSFDGVNACNHDVV